MTGADGHFVEGQLAAYTAMEKQPGWGDAAPEILRNGDWRYAVFTPEGTHKPNVNEAACMACHKPLDAQDYRVLDRRPEGKAGRRELIHVRRDR